MNEKMSRFLSSIHIENADDFDLDFDYIVRDRFDNKQWNMQINKSSPWEYHLLREFQDGLSTINYPCKLRFTYKCEIKAEDALNLFSDWYQTIYRKPTTYSLSTKDNSLVISLTKLTSVDESIIKDFKDFLDFISYEINVETNEINEEIEVETIKEETVSETSKEIEAETKIEESSLTLETPTEEKEVETDDEEECESSDSTMAQIEKEHQAEQVILEDALLRLMKENRENMKRERERARLNRRGNYTPIDLIDSIDASSDHVDFNGKIFSIEIRPAGPTKKIIIGVADKPGGAIYVEMYPNASFKEDTINELKNGTNIRVRGVAMVDQFSKALKIKGHYVDLLPPDELRDDDSEEKRVELHLHSKMSVQDGVGSMDKYCELAAHMGHKAIAITDHGVVQGYPDAQAAAKKYNIKMLYGSELYMIDSKQVYVFNPSDVELNKSTFCVLDLETTGLSTYYDRIIEFGAVRVEKGLVISSFDQLIKPDFAVSEKISNITNITNEMLEKEPTIEECIDNILEFIGDSIIVTHNASFDFGFLQETLKRLGRPILTNPVIDTLALSRYLFPESRGHTLGALCRNMDVVYDEDSAHRADYDATVLNDVWMPMLTQLTKDNYHMKHKELGELPTPKTLLKHIRPYHVTVLVKNKAGLKELYKLISLSNIEYLAEVPKVPRDELNAHRKDLIIGSACFNGEVFNTARYYNFDRLKQIVSFYDFIEIQPLANYSYLINTGDVDNEEQLKKYLSDIIRAADELNIPVVATGDAHYVNPEDKVFRDVYISAKAVGGVNHPLNPYKRQKGAYGHFENPDQHFRSTEEMLEAFAWLNDEQKIHDIVIKNTNDIADQCESIVPLPNDHLYTPKIEHCEEDMKEMVFKNAHDLYGDPLPEFIQNRLDTELNGIYGGGYSVIYFIAHKLVKKTNDDGYIVGSRGSVGSSLVATMMNITEVNPLPPHYRCPKCKHLEWTLETMPTITSGFDLPDKNCPCCGEKMIGDGQNIPFQTFLGFHAEKVPDIDLNFPRDYQSRAHNYTKELLGEKNVFRAGTIETVAEKTAFGFARGYFERLGYNPDTISSAKIAYLASGCTDVKRTTGQHPGGIVVVPSEYDVYDFTPIQYPAEEVEADWMTTHFDFHSIHDTILKLDLLGHLDPMALKMMCDLTHTPLKSIPLNDPEVISLFTTTKALKLKENYLQQTTGAMGIPEFGTSTTRGILEKTKPTAFSDLVIISGISHGTDVWKGNIEDIIDNKQATLREIIGCRDDIMTYLISKGIDPSVSFQIMEGVRKGKGLKEEQEAIMRANGVPDFYIGACKKIKYLFPKGHAVAYVTMAIRVGYFKVHFPLEYYATFFTVRSKQFDIFAMVKGEKAIKDRYQELTLKSKTKGEKLSPKEEEQLKTLTICVEMVCRGYGFANIDLYKSEASSFIVDHEHKQLIPPFICLDGLGESAAMSVVEARKDGEFFSKEDLLRRTKLNGTNVENLSELGVLDGLSESDQLSLFDF